MTHNTRNTQHDTIQHHCTACRTDGAPPTDLGYLRHVVKLVPAIQHVVNRLAHHRLDGLQVIRQLAHVGCGGWVLVFPALLLYRSVKLDESVLPSHRLCLCVFVCV